MNAGMYKSTTGMLYQASRLESITENLANANVPGYKRTMSSTKPFIGTFQSALYNEMPEAGTTLSKAVTDFTTGPMRQTDRSLDFAIEGNGFFVVRRGDTEFYTRSGAFTLDETGTLVTYGNLKVGRTDITLSPETNLENLTVDTGGTLRDGANVVGQIDMVNFSTPSKLDRVGPGMFSAHSDMTADPVESDARMYNRLLEHSNASVITEMVEMVDCMRCYEACQKMITIQDGKDGMLISRLM